ncbi:helix-turn-helix domain-containing protein [Micromonospora coriariae]
MEGDSCRVEDRSLGRVPGHQRPTAEHQQPARGSTFGRSRGGGFSRSAQWARRVDENASIRSRELLMTAHLTVEQRQLARRLSAKGLSLREIGRKVGCSHEIVRTVVRHESKRPVRSASCRPGGNQSWPAWRRVVHGDRCPARQGHLDGVPGSGW